MVLKSGLLYSYMLQIIQYDSNKVRISFSQKFARHIADNTRTEEVRLEGDSVSSRRGWGTRMTSLYSECLQHHCIISVYRCNQAYFPVKLRVILL